LVESIPNVDGDKSFVVKCHLRRMRTRYSDGVRFPAIIAASVEVQIANLVCAWSTYVEGVR